MTFSSPDIPPSQFSERLSYPASRLHRNWLRAAAVLLVVFEIATVLILRAHYTMDIFAGMVAALWIANFTERISPRFDHLLSPKN